MEQPGFVNKDKRICEINIALSTQKITQAYLVWILQSRNLNHLNISSSHVNHYEHALFFPNVYM